MSKKRLKMESELVELSYDLVTSCSVDEFSKKGCARSIYLKMVKLVYPDVYRMLVDRGEGD